MFFVFVFTDGNVLQFENGYLVETVVEGNEIGVVPYKIRVSEDGELFSVDEVNSNIVKITPPLSQCMCSIFLNMRIITVYFCLVFLRLLFSESNGKNIMLWVCWNCLFSFINLVIYMCFVLFCHY